jgi:hypothetical protein
LALAIFAGAGILVSSASAAGGPSPSPSPIPQGCQLQSPQPEAPLALNVVAVRNLVKTVAIEKEVFSCFDSSSTLAQLKEVDTLIELTARGGTGFVPLTKTVNANTCTKNLKTGGVSCTSVALPLGVTTTPLAKCSLTEGTYPFAPVVQPTHPLQMETATLDNGLVETVALEKEVFDCAGQIGDVYLFTEVGEAAKGGGFGQLGTKFEGIVCFKDEATATVVACKLFTPTAASAG